MSISIISFLLKYKKQIIFSIIILSIIIYISVLKINIHNKEDKIEKMQQNIEELNKNLEIQKKSYDLLNNDLESCNNEKNEIMTHYTNNLNTIIQQCKYETEVTKIVGTIPCPPCKCTDGKIPCEETNQSTLKIVEELQKNTQELK